ncbi:MAG: GNAT family N-acetyltransferase [Legionella sp.]|nr:GNAT family N-acetyltransferase [Legionella sp.]
MHNHSPQSKVEFKELPTSFVGLSEILKPSVGDPTPEKMEQVLLSYTQPGHHLIGAFLKTELVAVVGLQFEENHAIIKHIAVAQNNRTQGLGKAMLIYVLFHFPIESLYSETDDEAYGFYQQCGFQCEEFISKYSKRFSCRLAKKMIKHFS